MMGWSTKMSNKSIELCVDFKSVLSNENLTDVISELLKYILYQRQQVPLQVQVLQREVQKHLSASLQKDGEMQCQESVDSLYVGVSKKVSAATTIRHNLQQLKVQQTRLKQVKVYRRYFTKVENFVRNFELVTQALQSELSSASSVMAIRVLLGCSYVTATEAYTVYLPPMNSTKVSGTDSRTITRTLFRTFITNQELTSLVNSRSTLKKMWILVLKPRAAYSTARQTHLRDNSEKLCTQSAALQPFVWLPRLHYVLSKRTKEVNVYITTPLPASASALCNSTVPAADPAVCWSQGNRLLPSLAKELRMGTASQEHDAPLQCLEHMDTMPVEISIDTMQHRESFDKLNIPVSISSKNRAAKTSNCRYALPFSGISCALTGDNLTVVDMVQTPVVNGRFVPLNPISSALMSCPCRSQHMSTNETPKTNFKGNFNESFAETGTTSCCCTHSSTICKCEFNSNQSTVIHSSFVTPSVKIRVSSNKNETFACKESAFESVVKTPMTLSRGSKFATPNVLFSMDSAFKNNVSVTQTPCSSFVAVRNMHTCKKTVPMIETPIHTLPVRSEVLKHDCDTQLALSTNKEILVSSNNNLMLSPILQTPVTSLKCSGLFPNNISDSVDSDESTMIQCNGVSFADSEMRPGKIYASLHGKIDAVPQPNLVDSGIAPVCQKRNHEVHTSSCSSNYNCSQRREIKSQKRCAGNDSQIALLDKCSDKPSLFSGQVYSGDRNASVAVTSSSYLAEDSLLPLLSECRRQERDTQYSVANYAESLPSSCSRSYQARIEGSVGVDFIWYQLSLPLVGFREQPVARPSKTYDDLLL